MNQELDLLDQHELISQEEHGLSISDHQLIAPEARAEPEIKHHFQIVYDATGTIDSSYSESSASSSSSESEEGNAPVTNRTIPEQREAIIRLHAEEQSRRQIAKAVGCSAKTVQRVLDTSGLPISPWKRGRKSAMTSREEDALVKFLLQLDKVNLNWTWPLLHKLLEILSRKKAGGNLPGKVYSSKWLVGFTKRHRKKISLRVVDYGLSAPLQTKQKTHPGRMEEFEQMLRELFLEIGIPDAMENIQEVQDMWCQHVESPKTRKVFALKGRKNVRLTIGLPSMEVGLKKRVRKRPTAQQQQQQLQLQTQQLQQNQAVLLVPGGSHYQLPPVNDTALRLAMNAFMIAGYTEADGKKILRDLNVPI